MIERLRTFIEDEDCSCSMDIGGIKPLYVLGCGEAVSLLYMGLQLVVSLGFIYLCPATMLAHWAYLLAAVVVLCCGYVLFMKKYYHLHEEYLASLKKD